MKHIKTNLIYGVLALIPIMAIAVVLGFGAEMVNTLMTKLGFDSMSSAFLALLLTLVSTLVAIYVLGMIVHTRVGNWTFDVIERKLLSQIPGYRIISGVLKGFVETSDEYRPALVSLYQPGTAVLGFVMEENDNDTFTIFVPTTPAMTVGTLHIVNKPLVTLLEASHVDTINCFTDWGIGSRKILGKQKLKGVED